MNTTPHMQRRLDEKPNENVRTAAETARKDIQEFEPPAWVAILQDGLKRRGPHEPRHAASYLAM